MLSLPPSIRIYFCILPTDMRRSFDGLARMAECEMKKDPFSGNFYVFRNRRGDRLKILYWDRDGYALWYKRLEEGTFQMPDVTQAKEALELSATDLMVLLEGIDLSKVKRLKRYQRCTV